MLFERRPMPLNEVRRDEVFDIVGREDRYIKTRRGIKRMHDHGDAVSLDPELPVVLSYQSTLHRERLERTNGLIKHLTDAGLTFFSSVYTTLDEYRAITYHVPCRDAWEDTMFFGMEGRPLLLVVRLNYTHVEPSQPRSGENMWWTATLVGKTLSRDALDIESKFMGFDAAQVSVDNHHAWPLPTVPRAPLFDPQWSPPAFDLDTAPAAYREGLGIVFSRTYRQFSCLILSPQDVADALVPGIRKVMPLFGLGPIGELDVRWMLPLSFKNAQDDFWTAFNSSYLCKIVRRPRGMPRFSTPAS